MNIKEQLELLREIKANIKRILIKRKVLTEEDNKPFSAYAELINNIEGGSKEPSISDYRIKSTNLYSQILGRINEEISVKKENEVNI